MRFLSGVGWGLFSGMITRGLGLFASLLVARMLHREGFGTLGMLQSTIGLFATFAGAGLGVTVTRHVAECRATDPERAGRLIRLVRRLALITGLFFAVVLLLLSPWLAGQVLAAPRLAPLLQLSTLLVVLGAVNEIQVGTIYALEGFRVLARVNLISAGVSCLFLVTGVWYGGVAGAAWALIATLAVTTGLNYLALCHTMTQAGIPRVAVPRRQEWDTVWRFSLLAVIAGTMVSPVHWLCHSLLVKQPHGFAEMGLYSAAVQWAGIIYFLPNTVGTVLLPMLSNLYDPRDTGRFETLLRCGVLLNGGVALVLAVALAASSRLILAGYGADFLAGRTTFLIVIASAVIMAVTHTFNRAITSQGAIGVNLAFTGLWSLCFLLCSLSFVSRYQAEGLALSGLLAVSCEGIGQWSYLAWRKGRPAL